MLIRDLFQSDVTRDIPPVVYFHEQNPARLASEVSEYIITGGWPEGHPNHRRVPRGIHEEYVRLLSQLALELDKPGGPQLPTAWISGFYGSGKSSFAKLLGLALDGVVLPDGTTLADAWLNRDTSPRSQELRAAWTTLRSKVKPLAVVFDMGGVARDNEHIHSAIVRMVQRRLGYCSTEPLVADFELKLERDGVWTVFERKAQEVLGRPWSEVKDRSLAEEDFSLVLSELFPERYTDPMSWFASRGGTHQRAESPEEAVAAIRDMLSFRCPGATLFLVVDEVSQYVLSSKDRVDRLRAFATALGATLKGRAWLLALGQQKLDEDADDSFLVWARDRFPSQLRVHLAPTNIRDVVHKRLLQKKTEVEEQLRKLFETHRPDLKLFAFGCEGVTPDEFIEVYPMLPGHIDLLLQITSALRTRSSRVQGDDQAIRGLLQLLGELFRARKLADMPVGALVTLDQIYEVQHTALESDVQQSMARILSQCADDASGLMVRVAKAVALLELIQETMPTDARLVAQCLYDRVDRGNQVSEVTDALEALKRRNLISYSEKTGYKIQSSAGEEWERERRDIGVPREALSEIIQDALKYLMGLPDRPRLQGRSFPWGALFSDGRRISDALLVDPRDDAAVLVDFRLVLREEQAESGWINESNSNALNSRLLWVAGEAERVEELSRELARSRQMVKKYDARRESLNAARKMLLQLEKNRTEDLERLITDAVATAWMGGRMYFRGRAAHPREQGSTFALALTAEANRILPDLYPYFIPTQLLPSELMLLVEPELSGPSTKFLPPELGILELDSGRYQAACSGVIPRRVLEHIEREDGLSGQSLLTHFGKPPFGYTVNVVKACVAGLLRGGKTRIQPESGSTLTAIRDAGVREVFDKDRAFRKATLFPAGQDDVGPQARSRICKFFEQQLGQRVERENQSIADAVAQHFPAQAGRLRQVLTRLQKVPDMPDAPLALQRLETALEQCLRSCRETEPTVKQVKHNLDTLRDGFQLLNLYDAELTHAVCIELNHAAQIRDQQGAQLAKQEGLGPEVGAALERIDAQLKGQRPWQDLTSIQGDLATLRALYVRERTRLLEWQESLTESARARVKAREGFMTLMGDDKHRVLRPLALAATETAADAVAPSLEDLKEPFLVRLRGAEDKANEVLDELLSRDNAPLIVKVDLGLRNRELGSEREVELLLEEIRRKLMGQLSAGVRVRLG